MYENPNTIPNQKSKYRKNLFYTCTDPESFVSGGWGGGSSCDVLSGFFF